jgi:hypothetical protein
MIDFIAVGTGTPVAAAHFQQLLAAVNAVRAAAGSDNVSWTAILPNGVPPPASGVVVSAHHLKSLRASMNAALSALGLTPGTYSEPEPLGAVIFLRHIDQLRQRSQ